MNSKLIACLMAFLALHVSLTAAVPPAYSDLDKSSSEMRPLIERYSADQGKIVRFYNIPSSPQRRARLRRFYAETKTALEAQNFEAMSRDGKIDYILFRNGIEHELRQLDRQDEEEAENAAYVPFAATIIDFEEARQQMKPLDPIKTAQLLGKLNKEIEASRQAVEARLGGDTGAQATQLRRIVGNRAANEAASLRNSLRTWFTFYDGYDPMFTWWDEEAYRTVDASLQSYTSFLRERVAGLRPARPEATSSGPGRGAYAAAIAAALAGSTDDIVGNPIGREGLMSELAYEMIPYTPEELIAIANKEFVWCEGEMKKAAREMGFGDDWRAALEKVKNMYVEPGKQPQMIRDLALEAEKFLDDHDLVTVPELARETWRMDMMTPERQLVNPFFTGGEAISVSYPVNTMGYEQKMMSMRGNNIPMSRATVFHELIPGHNLQGFYAARFKPYRSIIGGTPFVTEGWSLYWELLMWDLKFQRTPEDRVGALFWHMHRCARIIFSLNFHLGKMTAIDCINMLVERVGFERENAVGEVRRSFGGGYSPLYQAAYLLGGMQLKALHDSMVGPGRWTNRQFNDAVLKENRIPIELIRASLTKQALTRDYRSSWKFAGDI